MEVDDLWLRLLSRSEDIADEVSRRSRHVLPIVARLFLTATFLEDALRMWLHFSEYLEYLQLQLNCSELLSVFVVIVNLIGQLLGSVLVLFRVWVNLAVLLLGGMLLLQVQLHMVPWQLQLLLRSAALLGGLLLLHVETQEQRLCGTGAEAGAGVPLLVNRRPQHLMRLAGRALLACMYLTLLRFELCIPAVVLNSFGVMLMAFIVLGYRTRLAALTLALLLTLWNLFSNSWWLIHDASGDLFKYNCFHTLSVVGGLLHDAVLGPGQVSLEQYKKRW
ncbi:hypothetical protein ACLKA7_008249 [Drosophila subpalustris]